MKMTEKKPRVTSSSSSSTSAFSSDDETDVRDLKSIKGYLSDRRELARQLFKSVKTEKIRMMLPQILKAMDFNDLEEWCASELSGMSEARILSIVNGQPMLDSSDTSETDDSGPSLEIISDTEEWLTDTDVPIKEEPSSSGASKPKRVKSNRSNRKNPIAKNNETEKKRTRAKTRVHAGPGNPSEVKIKKEKDNRATTNKEGESLLDLLELEMRARAIRALIRKEEDVIPSPASEIRMAMTADALKNTLNSAMTASLASKKSCNEKSNTYDSTANNGAAISPKKSKLGVKSPDDTIDDEDVVFVVTQPTPTIELLSSDNEDANERSSEKVKKCNSNDVATTTETSNPRQNKSEKNCGSTIGRENPTSTKGRVVTIDKSVVGPDNLKIVITKKVGESSNAASLGKSIKSKKNVVPASAARIAEKTAEKNVGDVKQLGNGLFKKIKKKQHLRTKRKKTTEDFRSERDATARSAENTSGVTTETSKPSDVGTSTVMGSNAGDGDRKQAGDSAKMVDASVVKIEVTEIGERPNDSASRADDGEARRKARRRVTSDEDRLDDFEEIIDLDHYSDDMDEMENNEISRAPNGSVESTTVKSLIVKDAKADEKMLSIEKRLTRDKSESSETWATRYYQTDDVQNVIKESKIQSEIRKRLRERQRQSKLNSSPKMNCPGDANVVSEKIEETIESKPTGSVQEYLALKNVSANSADDVDGDAARNDKSPADEKSVGDRENSTSPPEKTAESPTTTNSNQEKSTDLVSTETVKVQQFRY